MTTGQLAKEFCQNIELVHFFISSPLKQEELDKTSTELGQRKEDPGIAYRDVYIPFKCVHDGPWRSACSMVKRLVDLKPALQPFIQVEEYQ